MNNPTHHPPPNPPQRPAHDHDTTTARSGRHRVPGMTLPHPAGHPSRRPPDDPTTDDTTTPPEEPPRFTLWIPTVTGPDRLEHCVTFAQVAATTQAATGIYLALCGLRFAPAAAMTEPPWPHCPDCAHHRRHWAQHWRRTHQPLRTRHRLLRRTRDILRNHLGDWGRARAH